MPEQLTLNIANLPRRDPTRPGLRLAIDREDYARRCRQRWMGEQLRDAFYNWRDFQAMQADLAAALRVYRDNPCLEDLNGETHSDGSLTSFLWKLQEAWEPDRSYLLPLLDFCEHYQKVFLRRGLLIYCGQILRILEGGHERGD